MSRSAASWHSEVAPVGAGRADCLAPTGGFCCDLSPGQGAAARRSGSGLSIAELARLGEERGSGIDGRVDPLRIDVLLRRLCFGTSRFDCAIPA